MDGPEESHENQTASLQHADYLRISNQKGKTSC
jgi:hypothetical protein